MWEEGRGVGCATRFREAIEISFYRREERDVEDRYRRLWSFDEVEEY
jgi:phage terminase Nu1 subunit (DNA packaging protein)